MTGNPVFRLAMRVEGHVWNAYVAPLATMNGAIWIGSIDIRFIENNAARKKAFLALMRDSLSEIMDVHRWDEPVAAPAHERTSSD